MKISKSIIIFEALLSFSLLLFPLTSLAQTNAVRARVTEAVDMQNLATLRGNVHPLARAEFDQGVAPDDLPMERMLLVLQRSADQEAALRKLLDEQQVKSSSQFHQWLTPEQFGQQFGPADADLQTVTDWLASQGFEVTKVSAGRTVIEFSGTAGLVRQVLGTEIHKFRVNGEDHWANTRDPQIPAALQPVVAGFASLNNFPRKPLYKSLGTFTRSKATGKVQPLFTFPTSCGPGYPASDTCYYLALGPADFATIYNVLPLWNSATPIDGTGQTIAVVGETEINPQDVADFRAMFGLPAKAPNIILNGPDPGITSIGEEAEADLDVQWSGAVARGATIDFVVSETTETTAGIDLSALYIIDNNLAPVMSESYGSCEAELGAAGNQFYNTLWEQAAAQGITVLMAAGDSGPAGCDSANAGEIAAQYGLAVSGLASTPFNVALGGTNFSLDSSNVSTYWSQTNNPITFSSALSYIPESTWDNYCLPGASCPPASYSTTYLDEGAYLYAGGGGPSSCTTPASSGVYPGFTCSGGYSKPSWQSGTNVPQDGARDIPDLSLFAGGNSFYVICQMDANASIGGSSNSCDLNSPYLDFQGGGGTSASVQAFAGIMAMVNQAHGRQGNANYVLYPMAAQSGASCNSSTAPPSNSSCIFYDVTVGNNTVICQGGSPNCSSTAPGGYGVMVYGNSDAIAYPTTTGYDLATGLGSVNVANLVDKWKSNFTTTTTSLSLSTSPATNPITLTHGQPIDFTVKVTSGSGTPAGDISLIAQAGSSSNNVTGIGPFTLSSGNVSGSTLMLPGGSYNVTAHYAGNGTFAASDSTPGIPVTVSKESSQTKISLVTFDPNTGATTSNNGTTPYGSPYVLRMDVMHSSDGNPCASATTGLISYPCPTGALTVSPKPTDANPPVGTVAGSYTLNSQGYAEDEPIQQTPGLYNFVAQYAGDNSYKSSTSPTVPITITKAPTTTTQTGLPTSTDDGGSVFLNLTVNTQSNGVGPTGTVQLLSNGVPVGSPSTIFGTPYSPSTGAYASGYASIGATLPLGSNVVTVQYSGDANYAGSTSAPGTVTAVDYTISANPTSLNISTPGNSATSLISTTPEGGFTGITTLSCGVPPDVGLTCTVSPSLINVTGSSAMAATLTVNSTANSRMKPRTPQPELPPALRQPVEWPWLLAGFLALATFLSLAAPRRRPAVWLFVTALIVAGVWVACGGGGAGNGGGGGSTPAPAVSLSATSLSFGQVTLGHSSATQPVTITNTGTATLNISSDSGNGADWQEFTALQDNCWGAVIAPGANCGVIMSFGPQAPGLRTASWAFTDNASGSPQAISLSGTGVQPSTPAGTYFVGVLSTNGLLTHQTTLTLTVQ